MEKNLIQKIKKMPLTVLSTFGHNGLDWVHSLVDNHSQILIMPAFSFFRSLDRIKLHNKNIKFKEKKTLILLAKLFSKMFYNDERNKVQRRQFIKNKKDMICFEKNLIFWILNCKIENLEKNLFLGIHYAFVKLYKIDLNKKKIIVHQEHVPWHSEKYYKIFNSNFIFMMRDPRAAIAGSVLRMQKHNSDQIYANQFDHVLLYWKFSEKFTKSADKKLLNKILILKNEDMHENLKKEMFKTSRFLDIKFSKTLLKQTFLGKNWFGESSYLQGKNQEDDLKKMPPKNYYNSNEIKKRWKKIINKKKILMIETILDSLMKKFNYKKMNNPNIFNKFLGLFICLSNYSSQKNYFLSVFLIKIRNLIRRLIILYQPSIANKIFKFI